MVKARTLGLLVAMTIAPAAFAQTNEALAEKLFREAQDAMKMGRYGEACTKFAASNRADAQLGTLLNLAACHEAEGKPATAWTDYTTLVDLAMKAHDDARADYARKRATALEPTLPQLAITIPRGVALTDVAIDEQHIAVAALATTIPVDPGHHTVALATATARWTQVVTVNASGVTTIEARVHVENPLVVAPLTAVSRGGSGFRTAGWAFFGATIASGVGGIVFGVIATSLKPDVVAGCDQNTGLCNADGYSASVTARATAWASTGLLIGVGVFAVTSIVCFALGEKAAKHVTVAARGLAMAW